MRKVDTWIDPEQKKPHKYRCVLVRVQALPSGKSTAMLGRWYGRNTFWAVADLEDVFCIHGVEGEAFTVTGWMELPSL